MKAATVERRGEPAHYIAWINSEDVSPCTPCRVEDISRSGARLRALNAMVPNEFTLHFTRKGDAKVRCRVTARAELSCDVEFVASLAIYS
jgi:hypothetical protein